MEKKEKIKIDDLYLKSVHKHIETAGYVKDLKLNDANSITDYKEKCINLLLLNYFGCVIGSLHYSYNFVHEKKILDHNFCNEILFRSIKMNLFSKIDFNVIKSEFLEHTDIYDFFSTSYLLSVIKKINPMEKKIIKQSDILIDDILKDKDIKNYIDFLKKNKKFDSAYLGTGNFATVVCMKIGLHINRKNFGNKYLDYLIPVSIKCSLITNNHPVGYLGGFSSALFTALAIENIDYKYFPLILVEIIDSEYFENIVKEVCDYKEYLLNKDFFIDTWKKYIYNKYNYSSNMKIDKLNINPLNNPAYRSKFYEENYSLPSKDRMVPGISGLDSMIIAYDSFIDSNTYEIEEKKQKKRIFSWDSLITYSTMHIGDTIVTGILCLGMYGLYYGMRNVPIINYNKDNKLKTLLKDYEQIFKDK